MSEEKTLAEQFEEFINLPEFDELEKYYNQPNLLKIVGKHRSETAHSAFWAWLLNPNESHGLGAEPLKLLVAAAIPEFDNAHTFNSISVKTEKAIQNFRLDIFIESQIDKNEKPFNIIIENKIDSNEREGQTKDYYEYCETNFTKAKNYYVYMKPYSKNLDDLILSVDVIKINGFSRLSYQKIYDNILLPIQQENKLSSINYISEYINSLSLTYNDDGHLIISTLENQLYNTIIDKCLKRIIGFLSWYGTDKSVENLRKFNNFFNVLYFITYIDDQRFKEHSELIRMILEGSRDFTKFNIIDIYTKKIVQKSISKNKIFNFVLKYLHTEKYTFTEFQNLIPIDLNSGFADFKAYRDIKYCNKKEAIADDGYKNTKRENPFFEFSNPIKLKDGVVVLKKAWTARRNPDFQNKRSIDILIEFINSKQELFGLKIEPTE